MIIMAIDLGKFKSMVCIDNKTSQKIPFETVATERGYFETMLKQLKPDLVVVEACGPSGWLRDLCEELEIEIIVCSTHEDAWLFKNVKRKTDKDDALKLARLAAMDQLVATHVPAKAIRERRRLIKYRKKLVDRINRSKSGIRSIFVNQGIPISNGAQTWHTGRTFLIDNAKPLDQCEANELWRGELRLELQQLQYAEEHLKTVKKQLELKLRKTRLARVALDVCARCQPNRQTLSIQPTLAQRCQHQALSSRQKKTVLENRRQSNCQWIHINLQITQPKLNQIPNIDPSRTTSREQPAENNQPRAIRRERSTGNDAKELSGRRCPLTAATGPLNR